MDKKVVLLTLVFSVLRHRLRLDSNEQLRLCSDRRKKIPSPQPDLISSLHLLVHVLLNPTGRMTTSLTSRIILRTRIFPRAETSNFTFPKALFGRSC